MALGRLGVDALAARHLQRLCCRVIRALVVGLPSERAQQSMWCTYRRMRSRCALGVTVSQLSHFPSSSREFDTSPWSFSPPHPLRYLLTSTAGRMWRVRGLRSVPWARRCRTRRLYFRAAGAVCASARAGVPPQASVQATRTAGPHWAVSQERCARAWIFTGG